MAISELDTAENAARVFWEDGLGVKDRVAPSALRPVISEVIRGVRDGLSDGALLLQLGNGQSKLYNQVWDSACKSILKALKDLVRRNA